MKCTEYVTQSKKVNKKYKCVECKHRTIEHQYSKDTCEKLGITLVDAELRYIDTKKCFEK